MMKIRRKIVITLLSGALVTANILPVYAGPGMSPGRQNEESGTMLSFGEPPEMQDGDKDSMPSFGAPPERPDNNDQMMSGDNTPPERPDDNDQMIPGDNAPPERPDDNDQMIPGDNAPPERPDDNDQMMPGNGTPPDRPDNKSVSRNEAPPERPDKNSKMNPGEETPPERPDGDQVSRNGAPPEKPDGEMPRGDRRTPSENGFPPERPDGEMPPDDGRTPSENGFPPERPGEDGNFPGENGPQGLSGSNEVSSNNFVVKQKIDVSSHFPEDTVKYRAFPKGSAKVNSKGIVKVRKAGEITIKGYNNSDEETGTYTFTSDKPVIKKKMKMTPGETVSANEFISGTETSPTSFSSSNEEVATVDEQGNVTVLKNGTARITASFGIGSDAAKYSMRIRVKTE